MSNPTELLDLDERAEFEAAQRKYHWPLAEADLRQDKIGNYYNHTTQANWSMWQTRAALVGRAQPEGEAPQAEPVAWMHPETLDVIHDDRKRAWESDFGLGGKAKAGGYTQPLYTAPAAQHAESGVSATSIEGLPRYKLVSGDQREWLAPAADGAWCMFDHAAALLAAQSQGAQPNEFEVAIYDCALMLNLPRGAAAMDVCRAVNRLATAAQQAAAPGLTDADENAPWLTLAHIVCQDAGIEPGHITKRLEALRTKLESAPGTPEAPASLDLSHITSVVLQDRGSKSVIVRFGQSMAAATKFLDQFGTLVLSQRAAQLDGGQEGSESNG